MNKIYLLLLLSLFGISIYSQSYVGLFSDSYSGVHSVLHNPANIADSRFKVDINLIGLSAYLGNDFYPFKATDAISSDFEIESSLRRFPSENNNFISNVDVLGPSVLLNVNKKTAIAFFTRARFFKNITNIDGNEFVRLQDAFDSNQGGFFTEEEGHFTQSAWSEIGFSVANILINKEKHFVKGGLSFKYLRSLGNAYGSFNDVAINFENDDDINNGLVTTTGSVTYANTDNLNNDLSNFETVKKASALAFDLGLVYEYRPDRLANTRKSPGHNKYSLKLGLSLTDIGAITHDGIEDTFNINESISSEEFVSIESPNDIRNFYDIQLTSQYKKASLPTAAHLFMDWRLGKKTYVNVNGDLSLRNSAAENKSKIANALRVTPRFETKLLSLLLPISVQQYSGIEVGGGIRFGPIYAGSGSFFTSLLKQETQAADAYLGVKIPIYQPKSKLAELEEDDDDEFYDDDLADAKDNKEQDKKDKRTERDKKRYEEHLEKQNKKNERDLEKENRRIAKLKNKKDSDNDGIPDDEDKCPNYAGNYKTGGCPSKDSNNDGIPDSYDIDGDGVVNKLDNCPEVPGVKSESGCPKVSSRSRRSINKNAKTVLFATGSTEIHPHAKIILTGIIAIIEANPNSQFIVEGHTDNTGGEVLNDKLSFSRAHAVMNYLIENGIDRSRLSTRGLGAQKPLNKNRTETEREQNRRVEIYMLK